MNTNKKGFSFWFSFVFIRVHSWLDFLYYPSPGWIARAQFNLDSISFYQTNPIPFGGSGSSGQQGLPVLQFQPVQQAGQFLYNPG